MSMNALFALLLGALAQDKEPATTKQAMFPIQLLVGEWRVTVESNVGNEDGWTETHSWEYKIEKETYALRFTVKEGKRAKDGVLSYDLKKKVYRLDLNRPDGTKVAYEGKLQGKELSLEEVGKDKEPERWVFTLLRHNRFLVAIETRQGASTWLMTHSLGCTKEGVPFVTSEAPKCPVTGGIGTIEVQHAGKSYYVC